MPYENPFLARLATGGPSVGGWVSTPDPVFAELIASIGFHHVVVDMQHGSIELGTLIPVLTAISSGGSVAVVRVPTNDPIVIGKVLDLGALAVIIPMVETAEQAARAVAACRYAPAGDRSVGPLRTTVVMRSEEPADWERVACIVMIETATGLANVEAIVSTPGIAGVYVGPGDLALSLGVSPFPERRSPADAATHRAALDTIRTTCERHGLPCGLYVGDGVRARASLDEGFRIVTASIDYSLIEVGARRDLAAALGAAGAAP